jgi:hypothetical protein
MLTHGDRTGKNAQKISLKKPRTTSRPMMKMMRTAQPRNLSIPRA